MFEHSGGRTISTERIDEWKRPFDVVRADEYDALHADLQEAQHERDLWHERAEGLYQQIEAARALLSDLYALSVAPPLKCDPITHTFEGGPPPLGTEAEFQYRREQANPFDPKDSA